MAPSARPDDFTTPLGKALASLNLVKEATRLEDAGRYQYESDGNCDEWTTFHAWDPKLRFTQPYANKQAELHLRKFRYAAVLLDSLFTKLKFTFPLVAAPAAKMFLMTLPRLLKRFAPNHIRNTGASDTSLIVKVISFDLLNDLQAAELTARLPRGAGFQYSTEPACDYERQLKRLCRADLPNAPENAAIFAYLIKSVRITSACGSAYTLIPHSILIEQPRKLLPPRPHNPDTGRPSLRHTQKSAVLPPREEISATDWEQYPDYYENDSTTDAEYREMLDSLVMGEPEDPQPAVADPPAD